MNSCRIQEWPHKMQLLRSFSLPPSLTSFSLLSKSHFHPFGSLLSSLSHGSAASLFLRHPPHISWSHRALDLSPAGVLLLLSLLAPRKCKRDKLRRKTFSCQSLKFHRTRAILREGFSLRKLKLTNRFFSFHAAFQAKAPKHDSLCELGECFLNAFETQNLTSLKPGPNALPSCSPEPNGVLLAGERAGMIINLVRCL